VKFAKSGLILRANYTALRSVKKADKSFATLACDAATGHMAGPTFADRAGSRGG
jgi:hypothetical protein